MTFLYRKPHFSPLSLCVACHIYRKTQPSNMLSWAMDPLLNNSLGVRKRKISEMKIFNTLVSPVLDCHGNQNEYTSVKVKSIDRTLLSYKLKKPNCQKARQYWNLLLFEAYCPRSHLKMIVFYLYFICTNYIYQMCGTG